MTSTALIVRGTFVQCASNTQLDILEDHILAVNNLGVISFFGDALSSQAVSVLEGPSGPSVIQIPEGSFVIPSFVDLHLHAPQFLYSGTGLHLPLMEWLHEYAFKAEERLDSDPELSRRLYSRLAQRLKQNGTGAVMLFGTIKEETNLILAECMHKAGLRAFVGKLSIDQNSRPTYIEPSAQASIDSAESFVRKMDSMFPKPRLVHAAVTPRFVPTCSDELLVGLGKLAASHELRIQSHLAESHDQVSAVLLERNAEDIDVFERSQLHSDRTIQAHCTFLDQANLSRLRDSGTAVAHCPLSNAYFSAEPFRLREAIDQGLKVGLGTDIAGGYSLDSMNAMRQAVITSRMRQGYNIIREEAAEDRSVGWIETLFLATRGGSMALGLSTGLFEVGAPFDGQQIMLWDATTSEGIGALDFFDIEDMRLDVAVLEKWWCLGDYRNRTGMWIQGTAI